jgi:hypothetical protein
LLNDPISFEPKGGQGLLGGKLELSGSGLGTPREGAAAGVFGFGFFI